MSTLHIYTEQLTLDVVQPQPAHKHSVADFRYNRSPRTVEALARDYDAALATIERYQDERALLEFNIVEMRAVLELIANDALPSCTLRHCLHPACALVERYRDEAKDALLRVGGTVHHG